MLPVNEDQDDIIRKKIHPRSVRQTFLLSQKGTPLDGLNEGMSTTTIWRLTNANGPLHSATIVRKDISSALWINAIDSGATASPHACHKLATRLPHACHTLNIL